jgi:pimeloyl-ACP methyl ester carboxylesterase
MSTLLSPPSCYWTWRGYRIHYVRAGEPRGDRPALLLVHGFGASTDHWRKNIAELQHDFEVFAIDLLGFGRSQKPPETYSGALWQAQLSDFLTEVVGRPAVLAGNSLGGYASLCVAANHPDQSAGLVLLNSAGPFTPAQPQPEPSPLEQARRRLVKALFGQPWVAWLIFKNIQRRSAIRKTLLKVYCDPTAVTDQLVEDIYRPSTDAGAFQVFASVFKTPQGETVDALLAKLRAPLLLLWGEGDPWMKARARSDQFRAHYPQLQEVFLQAGHCPHDEVPEQVNARMRDWVLQNLEVAV